MLVINSFDEVTNVDVNVQPLYASVVLFGVVTEFSGFFVVRFGFWVEEDYF